MDLLRAMDLFVRIVDRGSLTAAAADCDLSPTMVGNHLHALENRLGARLLNRTTRRQSLTDFGKTYYQRCVEILELVRGAEALALEAQSVPKGFLRITAPVTFGTERLMPAIANYAASYPRVDLDIVITDTVVDLAADGFEAAIRIGNPRDADLVARPLPTAGAVSASPLRRSAISRRARRAAATGGFQPTRLLGVQLPVALRMAFDGSRVAHSWSGRSYHYPFCSTSAR
jgi:DNA-binding transcriptional LysR family regulator